MNFLPTPKILNWDYSLDQTYQTKQSILVTSGCSFTASTLSLEYAASWPGYVRDRCHFEYAIDLSYAGAGNEYIGDSILHFFKNLPLTEYSKYCVIIMWSGLDRLETKIKNSNQFPNISLTHYKRVSNVDQKLSTEVSYNKIIEVYNFLKENNIKFAFTFYANVLFPPYLPKRDTTHEINEYLGQDKVNNIRNLNWIPKNPKDFLFDYAFFNDYLDKSLDHYHPPWECNLEWTDRILLPALCKDLGIISKVDH